MGKYAIIKDNVIIAVPLWDGITEWDYPEPYDSKIVLTEDINFIGIGWYWESNQWKQPIEPEPMIEDETV